MVGTGPWEYKKQDVLFRGLDDEIMLRSG